MESFRTLVADVRSYIQRIVGLSDWRSVPDINLHDASGQIKAIIGLTDDMSVPDITLHDASGQIKAIIGLTEDMSTPEITLAATRVHVDTTPATGTLHGITGWATAPVALGAAAAGSATTIARSDHVHPTTGLMLTSHVANGITALGGTPAALGTINNGSGTALALSNHVHPKPSTADLGAQPLDSTLSSIAGLNPTADKTIYFTGTNVAATTSLSALGRTLLADTTEAQMHTTLGVSAAGTFNNTGTENNLSGATVYMRAQVVKGLVTALVTRNLTAADIGAQETTTALTALGGLTPANNRVPYFTGTTTAGLLTLSTTGTNLLSAADATTARGYVAAAALAGSATQSFAAYALDVTTTLTANKCVAARGTGGGLQGDGITARVGFSASADAAAVFSDGGLYVKDAANGPYTAVYASAFTVGSDERLKRGIRSARPGAGLAALTDLAREGLIHFRLKDEADEAPERLGFSAQKIALLAPDASRLLEPGDDPLLGWDTGAMIALLVDAVATLATRLDALERS